MPKGISRKIQVYLELDTYESAAVRKIQKMMRDKGKSLSDREFIRGCVRYFVHDILPQDFFLGPDTKKIFEDECKSRASGHKPEDPPSSES